MIWLIKSLPIIAAALITILVCASDIHTTIGCAFLWGAAGLTLLTIVISHLIFKHAMPKSYAKYQNWSTTVSEKKRRIAFFAPYLGCFLFFYLGLGYYNEYKVYTPIETVKTYLSYKRTTYGRTPSKRYYVTFNIFPDAVLEIDRYKLYEMLDLGDDVTIKIRKVRLGVYFALELKVEKNNYSIPL